MEVFPYSWGTYEENGTIGIRIFGLNDKNETVFVLVTGYTPYIYIELPEHIDWQQYRVQSLSAKLDTLVDKRNRPVKKSFDYKKKLYYAKKTKNESGEYTDKLYPFLKCSFACHTDIRPFMYKVIKPFYLEGVGTIKLKTHETDANPVLQFMCSRNVKPAGWFTFTNAKKIDSDDDKLSSCVHEFEVGHHRIVPVEKNTVSAPLIMGFDIEVNSSNPNVAPRIGVWEDKIFQISCVFCRNGDAENSYQKHILSLGKNKNGDLIDLQQETVGEDIEILLYNTEAELLTGFTDLVMEKNPQIITGYNIFSFDLPYMYARAKLTNCLNAFDQCSFIRGEHCKEKEINWSSAAFKNQKFTYIDAPGRLWVDMLPIIQRDYKLENYKLKTVSDFFLGQTKDPLTYKGIFKCYRMFTPESLSIVAKYCVKDSELVVKLFEKLQVWIGLTEMANTCNTPVFTLFTQGQQIKIFSQVYKKCLADNFVIDKDSFIVNETDHYTVSYVFTPVPGLYDMVVSFDFSSLYPSTIIAYNIDYSTLVMDDTIPDEQCHLFNWDEHILCEHDTTVRKTKPKQKVCANYKFRFLKEPAGVIPTLLRNLLDARKKTNAEIKRLKSSLSSLSYDEKALTERLITVLDKRQLSYKVSANSVAPNTPIPCIDGEGKFMYLTMEEISGGLWISDDEKNEVSHPKKDLSVWTDKGYTKIKYVIRHPIRTPLKRVLTHTGCVDVTDEHSLLDDKGKEVKPIDLSIGDKLMHRTLPLPHDTPSIPMFHTIHKETIETFDLKDVSHYEKAFLWGLFFAEGTAGTWGVLEKAKSSWIIYNLDFELLSRAKTILEKLEGMTFMIKFYESAGVYHLKPVGNTEGAIVNLCRTYRKLFYDCRGSKRIPAEILQADYYTRQSFFMGYYAGDGARFLEKGVVIHNKGEIGTAGLCYLAKSLGYIVSISYAPKKESIYRLQCCTEFRNKNTIAIKTILPSTPVPQIKKLQPDIIRNNTKIFFIDDNVVMYRNVKINCERIPRQKLVDAIDRLIHIMKKRQCSIIEYYTDSKKIKYQTWCCGKHSTTGVKGITDDNTTYIRICDCNKNVLDDGFNVVPSVEDVEDVEYIYDIETENHHFAAGVGDLIVHNSMYGGMGVKKGYLPFLPGAMCTTARGRESIEKASKFLTDHLGAKLIYGDTDSCYISFPQYSQTEQVKDLDNYCRQVEEEMTSLFPKPMKFAYEEAIYWRYLILSKKRYMALKCDTDGIVSNKIEKRGVLLSRRDNSAYSRDVYSKIIMNAFYKKPLGETLVLLHDEFNRLCSNNVSAKDLTISKSIGEIKDYKIRAFPDDDKKLEKRLTELNIFDKDSNIPIVRKMFQLFLDKSDEFEIMRHRHSLEYLIVQEYINKALPSQVQLAEKMRKRGTRVDAGERLGYCVIESDHNIKDKLFNKIEDIDYFKEHSSILKIDSLYYTKLLINPVDEVLSAVYDQKDICKKYYKARETYWKNIQEIKALFTPTIRLIE